MASAASTGWRSCYCQPLCAQYSAATSCTLHIRESWYVTTAAAWCHPAWILGPCQAARGHSGPHSLSGTGRHASRPPVTNNFCCWYGRRSSFLWEPDLLLCTTWEGQSVCLGLCYTNHNNITSSEFQKIQWPWKQNLWSLNIIKNGITHHMDNKKLSRCWDARATRLCLASSEYYFRFFLVYLKWKYGRQRAFGILLYYFVVDSNTKRWAVGNCTAEKNHFRCRHEPEIVVWRRIGCRRRLYTRPIGIRYADGRENGQKMASRRP